MTASNGIEPITPENPSERRHHVDEVASRAARRLPALRGLRAVPVHAGRDEERDADAVRDRLSGRLRAQRDARLRPHADAGHRHRRRRARHRRGALPAGLGREAQGHRAARAARRGAVARVASSSTTSRARPSSSSSGCPTAWARVTLQVENSTPLTEEEATGDRKDALLKSMLSTHLLAPRRGRPQVPLAAGARRRRRRRLLPGQHLAGARDAATTTRCWRRRSCCPTTPRSRRRASTTSSTAPRSRRRWCCTSRRCPIRSARRSARRTRRCARCSRAPTPRRRSSSWTCTGACASRIRPASARSPSTASRTAAARR